MASTCAGVIVSRKRYISARQVQKLSSPAPRRSLNPAMARWKACEWLLAGAGTSTPAR